ncbi:cytochrome o ubiquinol oxidase subunit III [Larsenimonas rhizosphaerae]|uniref:Cytochrome bo(3) ubiquinol oxidase subunit 3 n=1 Tax=Larsenimonas rhizosphaerae TaxID=2944682 RepID=A0AA41ZI08_9GAMM|nr:cytochrome o ubiquinol oxidase subunit III [Larsenimonas rhizosphaerae]MCM2132122.1 cytochrome o ubiquinol oxidase subunit III [Larsenimonas rhizosphaerae]MCX2525572.1 cytochrome o ubiquinol oxidase subunit III [Larsenimonas rhizosphaerae]
MSTEALNQHDAHASGHEHEHHDASDAKVLGFWVYLMTDCILFATVFATFAVLANSYAGGPTGADIFELPFVLVETMILLVSSFTFGMASIASHKGDSAPVLRWLAITALLGLSFIIMEIYEFHHLIVEGYGPDRSAFLSAFFTLVGTHGLHVTCGLIWLVVMMVQIKKNGLNTANNTRMMNLSLFWHFLDIIWIFVFTVVYLLGTL